MSIGKGFYKNLTNTEFHFGTTFIKLIQILVTIGIIALSLVNLEADPPLFKTTEDLMDEGAWCHNARCDLIFGHYITPPDTMGSSIIGGPLYSFLLRLSFSLGGVRLSSARMLSVVTFWAVLITIYLLFKRCGWGPFKSMLPVIVLGTNHQALIFAKWATPIFLEIVFLTLAFYLPMFAALSPKKSKANFLLLFSGLSFSAALASKGTAINMLLPYFISLFSVCYTTRLRAREHFLPILIGLTVGIVGIVLVWMRYSKYLGLFASFVINYEKADQIRGIIPTLKAIFFNIGMSNPMVFILCSGSLTLLGLRLATISKPYRTPELNRTLLFNRLIEQVSFVWLIFGHFGIFLTRDYPIYRRYILFLVPLSILYSRLVFVLSSWGFSNLKSYYKYSIACLLSLTLSIYLYSTEINLNAIWFPHIEFDPLFLFHSKFWPHAIICFAICGLFTFRSGIKIVALTLTSILVFMNLGFSADWINRATYTVRNASRLVATFTNPGDIGTGYYPWILFLDSSALPVFYTKDSRIKESHLSNFPNSLPNATKNIFIVKIGLNGLLLEKENKPFLNADDFPNFQIKESTLFQLMPYPYSNKPRFNLKLAKLSTY